MNAQETFNQAIVDLFDSMCDMVDCVADVSQFATVAQLTKVMEEGNALMRKAVDFFKEHKHRGILGEYLSSVDVMIYLSRHSIQGGLSPHFRQEPRKSWKSCK